MTKSGLTLAEYVVVLLVVLGVVVLVAVSLPGWRHSSQVASEARAEQLIATLSAAVRMYERENNVYPPTTSNFESGPSVYWLSLPGPKKQAYCDFSKNQVVEWPLSVRSHLRNPIHPEEQIWIRDNTLEPRLNGGPPVHYEYAVDIWARDHNGYEYGIHNWENP